MGLIGLMRPMGPMRPMRLIGLISLMSLMGCSSEEDEDTPFGGRGVPVEVRGIVAEYDEADEAKEANEANKTYETYESYGTYKTYDTRAWTVPSGYSLYEGEDPITVFFTQDGQPAGAGESPEEEFFFKSGDKWRVSKTDLAAATYYLYGYMPHDNSITTTISSTATANDNSAYSNGAVLTLTNLPAITPNDFCVIIGATNGKDYYRENEDYSVTSLARGNFAYEARTTGESGTGGNYVYLLFDHLYAAMQVRIRVHGAYDALRTIKLKELKLKTYAGDMQTKKKANATITLAKKTDGSDPISSIVFTPVPGDEVAEGSMFKDDDGMTLTTDYSTYICYFVSLGVTKFILESTYDVYDKNPSPNHPEGNLVRENCTATNTIVLSNLVSSQTETRRGAQYTINLTVQPTYLYMMSEPDADDPNLNKPEAVEG